MRSLRRAINQKCKECIYDSREEGTWRKQVGRCVSSNCPLFPYRPFPIDRICTNSIEKKVEAESIEATPIPTCPLPSKVGYSSINRANSLINQAHRK